MAFLVYADGGRRLRARWGCDGFAGPEVSLLLLCRVGTRLCGVPLEHVRETMRPLPADPVGGMPDFMLGLSVIRGAPVPVIDACALLSGTAAGAGATPPGRFVTLDVGARTAALAVDEVLGVRGLPPAALADLPPLLSDAGRDVVDAVGILDAELLLILHGARLVPASVWDAMDARGATG
jgi:purine-binding chemotaxis protein CheW